MTIPRIRPASPADRSRVAELICISTNAWYQGHGKPAIFTGGSDACSLFFDVYESLDPGCCLLAEDARSDRLMGSCFYHPRETHLSLGIMNVHPEFFGHGVARALLRFITDIADRDSKPVRLVSSAMNLDSYSLYTRAGFAPTEVYQDMIIPADRVLGGLVGADLSLVREATLADFGGIVELEWRHGHLRREKDWRHFIENSSGIWHVSVQPGIAGEVVGVLASVHHPGSHMLGPGVMADESVAINLIAAELTHHGGRTPLLLVPANQPRLVKQIYAWGGKNIELHVTQERPAKNGGVVHAASGVTMPTFMPETA